MWSCSTGGALAQSSPSYGPTAADYANMAATAVRSPLSTTDIQSSQMQQANINNIRFQQYMHGQLASPSFASAGTMSQAAYPVDPTGARPMSYPATQGTISSFSPSVTAYDQPMINGVQPNYGLSQQQQVMMAQNSALQAGYRCQQPYSAQQVRAYNQQRAVMMQQQAAANGMQQQPVFDLPMYPAGIPSATQRTPGMPGMMGSSQMRGMVVSGCNGVMVPSTGVPMPCGFPRPRGTMPPVYSGGGSSYPQGQSMMIRAGPPMLYSQMQHDVTRQQVVAYPNPNAAMRDPPEQFSRMSPSYSDNKIAFPVEVLLLPFFLDHNITTTDFVFNITQERFDSLRKGELDLQLKCFQHCDKKQLTQHNVWPVVSEQSMESSVKVFVNGVSVPITAIERALYVGRFCVVGMNKLVLSVSKCVCSHSFIMQLVNRRPVDVVLSEIYAQTREGIPNVSAAWEKLQKMIETDATQARISLVSQQPNGMQRLRIPARSIRCSHSGCFDLETFLIHNQDNAYFECPVSKCKSVFALAEIYVDLYVSHILSETARFPSVTEVNVESANGGYSIVDPLQTAFPQPTFSADYSQSSLLQAASASEQAPRAMKRERDSVDPMSSAGSYSLKRIRSEPFSGNSGMSNVKQEAQAQSPFNPNSVPAPPSGSWLQSPSGLLPSVLSPYGPSSSSSPSVAQPAQQRGPPSAPPKYGGPGTPATPSNSQNPPSIGPAPGTSPGGSQAQNAVQQQGSVDAASVAGSAPYTPASVGSLSSGAHCGVPAAAVASNGEATTQNSASNTFSEVSCSSSVTGIGELSCSLGPIEDFFDDLIFTDAKMSSAAEMQKYLNEDFFPGAGLNEIGAALRSEGETAPRANGDVQDWNDVAQVIAEQS